MKHLEAEQDIQIEVSTENTTIAPGEIIIGTLTTIDQQGQPLVNFTGNPKENPVSALSTQAITNSHIGRQVALLFANGELASPVIMGILHSPLHDLLENYTEPTSTRDASDSDSAKVETDLAVDDVLIDGKKITFDAKEEIVLKCGESSITLTKSGKVLIRGKYLLNRSSGVNRIMGGSVQVN